MKRCPLCEFIYEDDQNVCEMDGIALVEDNATLTAAEDVGSPDSDVAEKPRARKKSRARMLAALLIGSLLLLLNYASTNQSAKTASKPAPPPEPASPASVTEVAEVTEQPSVIPKRSGSETRNSARSIAVAPAPKAQARRSPVRPQNKDSKVGGFLKKTGRVLSKTFKF